MYKKLTFFLLVVFSVVSAFAETGFISETPVIDGKISKGEWNKAVKYSKFISTGKKDDPAEKSTAWFGYDKNRVYATFKCYESKPKSMKAAYKQRDGNIWMDDSVELFLDVNRKKGGYYHFIVNSQGAVFDQFCIPGEVGAKADWNASGIKIATGKGNGFWTVEFSVPLKNFKDISSVWGINLARSKQSPVEYSSAAGMKDGFHRPKKFISFSNKLPVNLYPCGIDIKSVGKRVQGENELKLKVTNNSDKAQKVTVKVNVSGPSGKVSSKATTIKLNGRSNKNVGIKYTLPELGRCKLVLELKKNGRIIFTNSKLVTCRKIDKLAQANNSKYPVYINKDNVLVVKGKKVFPLIFYRMPPSRYAELKNYGFNCAEVTNYAKDPKVFQARLDSAQAADIGMMCHEDFSAKRFLRSKLKKIIKKYKDNPALWAWYLADEPQNYGITPENAEDLYNVVKKADPGHPVFMVHSVPSLYDDYAKACDIFAIDFYPVPKSTMIDMSNALAIAQKTVKGKKPVWAAVQAYGHLKAGRRTPTPQEERCMVYLSIVHDVKGVLWFAWWGPEMGGTLEQKNPALFAEVLKLAKELKSLEPVLTAPAVKQKFSVSTTGKKLKCILKSYNGIKYLFAVNPYPEKIKAKFSVPGLKSVETLFENTKPKAKQTTFTQDFNQYDVHIYKIKQ